MKEFHVEFKPSTIVSVEQQSLETDYYWSVISW